MTTGDCMSSDDWPCSENGGEGGVRGAGAYEEFG